MLLNFITLTSLLVLAHGNLFGTGSSRHEPQELGEEIAKEYKEMIEDKEHIQEEFDNMFSKQDIRSMSSEEMAFNWFTGHDTDEDGSLDGLEIFKAISHSRAHKSMDPDHEHVHEDAESPSPPGVPPRTQPQPESQDDLDLGSEDIGAIRKIRILILYLWIESRIFFMFQNSPINY